MQIQMGADSLCLPKPVYIMQTASVVGKLEGEGPLGDCFDMICTDDRFGADSWERAESEMQKESLTLALGKAGMDGEQLRYLFAGDLLGQTIASSFGLMEFQRPFFGLYGACSTVGEALSLAAMSVAAGYADLVAAVTSSHFGGAERQFRFPIEYANQRPLCSTWTVTGSGAYILGTVKSGAKITGLTTGKIMDLGIRDAQNMGAAMAPAASALILNHMKDFERSPKDYDAIITGDLGSVGSEILAELCSISGCDITDNMTVAWRFLMQTSSTPVREAPAVAAQRSRWHPIICPVSYLANGNGSYLFRRERSYLRSVSMRATVYQALLMVS